MPRAASVHGSGSDQGPSTRSSGIRCSTIAAERMDYRRRCEQPARIRKAGAGVFAHLWERHVPVGESQDRSGGPTPIRRLRARKIHHLIAKDQALQCCFETIQRLDSAQRLRRILPCPLPQQTYGNFRRITWRGPPIGIPQSVGPSAPAHKCRCAFYRVGCNPGRPCAVQARRSPSLPPAMRSRPRSSARIRRCRSPRHPGWKESKAAHRSRRRRRTSDGL